MAQPKFNQAKSESFAADEKLRMLRDQILVKPIAVDRHSGLVVIDRGRKCIRGTVVAAGPGCRPIKRYRNDQGEVHMVGELPGLIPMEVRLGEVVELSPARYMEVKIGGEVHYIAKECDVAGVIS